MDRPVPPPPHPVRRPGFLGALTHAWEGLVWATAHQRNMKVHVVSAVLVGCVGSGIPLGLPERVTLIFCVLLVFFAEVVNTALEALVDLHMEAFHHLARVVKDTASAGVLVLSIGTVALFAVILVADWPIIEAHPGAVVRQLVVGGPMAAMGALLPWKRARARAADVALLAVAVALWAALASWTTSPVFSAMILGLLVLQASAAYELRWRKR
jgi:diacylglycerol kinase (ATP)